MNKLLYRGRNLVVAIVMGAIGSTALAQATYEYGDTAAPPAAAAVVAACHPGRDPLDPVARRDRPSKVAGATTISVAEAKCLVERFGESTLILAPNSKSVPTIKGTEWVDVPFDLTSDARAALGRWASEATGGQPGRPIIVACGIEGCYSDQVLAQALGAHGYGQVYWLRAGAIGWQKAGLELYRSEDVREEVLYCAEEQPAKQVAEDLPAIARVPDPATRATLIDRAAERASVNYLACLNDIVFLEDRTLHPIDREFVRSMESLSKVVSNMVRKKLDGTHR